MRRTNLLPAAGTILDRGAILEISLLLQDRLVTLQLAVGVAKGYAFQNRSNARSDRDVPATKPVGPIAGTRVHRGLISWLLNRSLL